MALVRLAEEPADLPGRDAVADERGVAGLQPERHLAADRLQTAGELADAPLAGVVADDPPAGACGEPDRRGRQTGGPVLRADQMRLGDGDLTRFGIAGQVDELEPVAQGRRDPGRLVRRGDEQHLGQVERQLDERIAEAVVLRRVEHFEQDGGRVGAELVDLVEHEDRVLAAHAPQLAQDGAGLRPLPGAVVAAQVRLVTQPAAGQLHEPAPEGLGDALGQRSLAGPRLPGQAEDRPRGLGWSRAHRQGARVGLRSRPRRGVSTVSRPRVCGHAASTSRRRVLTGSRPPWVRSSACFRCSGSNRCGCACAMAGRGPSRPGPAPRRPPEPGTRAPAERSAAASHARGLAGRPRPGW